MDGHAIELKGVTKTYSIRTKENGRKSSTNTVLDHIDLTVRKGEIIGVLGGNGSGKSTLLKILSNIIAPTEGRVVVNGKVASILELTVGFHDELSGLENIYIRAKLYGIPRKVIDERLGDIIEYADIGDYIHNPVRTYSSGMKSRLAFAVMVNVDADIFIIDEALSVGDSRFTIKTVGFLENLAVQGKTVLITSHSTYVLRSFCTRAVVLDGGKIVADGLPDVVCPAYDVIDLGSQEALVEHAGKGIPQAQYILSKRCLADGDREGYADWLSKAAYSNHPKAMVEYAAVRASEGDTAEAERLLLSAAKRGNTEAMWRYSAMTQGFDGGDIRHGLKAIARKGDHFDVYRFARYLDLTALNDDDLAQAYNEYERAARMGNKGACYEAALMKLNGIGTPIDSEGAIQDLRDLAEQGDMQAMQDLVRIYTDGTYISPDTKEQLRWQTKLANAGVARSQFAVAMMLMNGIGTEPDPAAAEEWLARYAVSSLEDPLADAADSAKIIGSKLPMDAYAINMSLIGGYSRRALISNLSVMLDVPNVKDKDLVFQLSQQAANSAGASSTVLAECYLKGIGTEPQVE
ncbi:MAG: ATP-binding cassette domain-containing protein, partial [Candidatus Methanomethylophilaceae archaeon]|nr:ATP-binding cassette domain-containing protein [Candidatus Methanomethylophilaceae archaeon]